MGKKWKEIGTWGSKVGDRSLRVVKRAQKEEADFSLNSL